MKKLISEIRPAILSTLVFAVACCGLYPLAVTGVGNLVFPDKAGGSLLRDRSGAVIGSSLIGQNFTGDGYFHPRPSAAGANGYDAASSSGSNLGPTSEKLANLIKDRVADYRTTNGLAENTEVPADAVTASGSGLDPHISQANAALQLARVAKARGLSGEKVRELVAAHTNKASLGIFGEEGVNVLKLNLSLDALLEVDHEKK